MKQYVCRSLLALVAFSMLLPAQNSVTNQGYVPFSESPIQYRTTPVNDPVAKLQKRLESGETTLRFEPGQAICGPYWSSWPFREARKLWCFKDLKFS